MSRMILAALAGTTVALACQQALAVTLDLKAGTFFGPGDKGVHPFTNGQVRNIELGPGGLQGVVPFFNNGAEPPNVIAEVLQGGPIDGFTSDGRAINENIDTALHLNLLDPESGLSGSLMVVSVEEEVVEADRQGNLVFNAHVVADPGIASLVRPFRVKFTSGAVTIPLSLRTQQGMGGGHDLAGPYPSGHTLIGRIGDFDHDGLLDGVLVQGENAPMDLVIAHGDPIAQHRPWVSDIPSTPALSALLNLNGIVQNFPGAITRAFSSGRIQAVVDYGYDINERLNAALYDAGAIIQSDSASFGQKMRARTARLLLRLGRLQVESGLDVLQDERWHRNGHRWHGRPHRKSLDRAAASMRRGLNTIAFALLQIAPDQPLSSKSAAAPNASEEDAARHAGEMLQQALGGAL